MAGTITEPELSSVIETCRSGKDLVYDPTDETYTCHAKVGHIVLWVQFKETDSEISLIDYYFNRTEISDVLPASEAESKRVSPYLTPYLDRSLTCVKCDEPLVLRKVVFKYLKQNYQAITLACPICGLVFEPHALIEHQYEKIEGVLQGK